MLSVTIGADMDENAEITAVNPGNSSEVYLQVQRGPLAGKLIHLQAGANVFGREEGCILPDERVSRRHARIMVLSGEYILIDLGSSNGTLVNGQRVNGPVMLQHADVIQLGGTVMVFYIRGMGENAVEGTGAATPAANPDQLSDRTLVTKKDLKRTKKF